MTEKGPESEMRCYINQPDHNLKIDEIKRRCEKSGLIFTEINSDGLQGYEILFSQNGFRSGTRWLHFPDDLDELADVQFENAALLENLEGIYDSHSNSVEVTLAGSTPLFLVPTFQLFAKGQTEVIVEPPSMNLPRIRIGKASKLHELLCYGRNSGSITITLTNLKGSNAVEIEKKVRSYAVPLLLEIEAKRGISLRLRRIVKKSMRIFRIEKERKEKLSEEKLSLTFPTNSYEYVPAMLFLLAQGFKYIPSLRFLFAYQALEFFFMRVSRRTAFTEISGIIRDPNFDVNNENHISRILNSIKIQWIKPEKNEAEQLSLLLKSHLTPSEIRNFIDNDGELMQHLSVTNNTTDVVIPK